MHRAGKERLGLPHKEFLDQDRISQLSDDILASIISKLTLPEAISTSILSSRWRYLSTYISHLNYCHFKPKPKSEPSEETIDKWFDFVLAKEVDVIKVCSGEFHDYSLNFFDLIGKKVEQQPLPTALNRLKKLSLNSVNMCDSEFEVLLSYIPLVETLSIKRCDKLRKVKIVDQLFDLKHLKLCRVFDLESVEIGNAKNLVSFKCFGKRLDGDYGVKLYNVPKFIDFATCDIGYWVKNELLGVLSRMPASIVAQLQILRVSTKKAVGWPKRMIPDLPNVKHLYLTLDMAQSYGGPAHRFIRLIRACRSLEKFEIKLLRFACHSRFEEESDAPNILEPDDEPPKRKFFIASLKKMKISGYLGNKQEKLLVFYILKNCDIEELVVEIYDGTEKIRSLATARSWKQFLPLRAATTPLFDLSCGKAINCLDIGGESCALIAGGGCDPILRIWDPRKPGTQSPIYQFSSHSSWISCCKWRNTSWFHLVSASYDGKMMLWDLRSAWPLAVIDTHNDKVLCADWWKGYNVISGGADSKLCISSGISVL